MIYFSLAYFFLSLFLSHMPTLTHTHYPQFPDTQPPINSHTLSLSLTHTFSHTHSLRSVPRGEDGFWSSFMASSSQSKTIARNISGTYVRYSFCLMSFFYYFYYYFFFVAIMIIDIISSFTTLFRYLFLI